MLQVHLLRSSRLTCTALLKLLDHAIEVRIARTKTPREPVAATPSNLLAVHDHVELPRLTGYTNGVDVQALLDEGHETRDLGAIVLSRRAVDDFDLHSVLQSQAVAALHLTRASDPSLKIQRL
jgi:hypothetical protein